jgi:hypothetical protein
MTTIGNAPVSTTDQDLSIQEAALKAAGCEVIRADARVRELKGQGIGATEIAKVLSIGRASAAPCERARDDDNKLMRARLPIGAPSQF